MKFTPQHLQVLNHFKTKAKEQQTLITVSNAEIQKLKRDYSDVVTKIHENRLTRGVSLTRNLRESRRLPDCTNCTARRWCRRPSRTS